MTKLSSVILSLVLAAGFAGCVRERPPSPDGVLVVSMEQHASWVRNFNPLTPATAPRWPTLAGIYEPLFVFNSLNGRFVPWLATDFEWRDNNRVLRITTRSGVDWSDGKTFSAEDVTFTLNLLKEHSALDRRGLWGFLEGVETVNDSTVDFTFQRVFIPGFEEIAAQQIVPRHIWSSVDDPVAFPNENPVATGPFTEVRVFQNQVYELGRNPNYWQPGKPYIEALRFPAFPSNDRANLALVFDEVDWAANFIPAIDRVYVARDPEHHRYWFPLSGGMVFLYANVLREPFNDVRVRKAMSMAIDRNLLTEVAAYNYSRAAGATGLSDVYSHWRKDDIGSQAGWTDYDLDRARALLNQAGYSPSAEGVLTLSDGKPWSYDIITVSGWSDWVRAAQVIARGLQDVGIDASVKTYDFGAWFQKVQRGEFDLCIGWSYEGPTPYSYYRWLMASDTVKPVGENARGNWHRYQSESADAALNAFEHEPDPVKQQALVEALQRTFAEEAPAIPLYPNPSWAEYNIRRFEDFPSPENPYADPSPNKFDRGETLLVLTTVRPRS